MTITKHFNNEFYNNGTDDIPRGTGDRYYAQDLSRDYNYLLDKAGLTLKDLFSNYPLKLSGGIVTQGAGDTLNITTGVGYAKYEVDLPDDFGVTTPPNIIQQDIEAIRIAWTAQTNLAIPSATLDGVTANYVKVAYNDADLNDRVRKKAIGTYYYELTPSFTITVDSTPSTDYEVLLATFTGSGGGSFTINNIEPQIGFNSYLNHFHIHEDQSTGYSAIIITNTDTGSTSSDGLTIGIDDSENFFIFNRENTDIYWGTNSNEEMRLKSGGFLGLNTVDPVNRLHIHQDDSNENYIRITNTTTGTTSSDGLRIGLDASESVIFQNFEDTANRFFTNDTETFQMTGTSANYSISTRGNIEVSGLNSGDRATWIDLIGDGTYTDFGLRIVRQSGAAGGSGIFSRGTGTFQILTQEAATIGLYTTNIARLFVLPDGRISTGAETSPDCAPGGLTLYRISGTNPHITMKTALTHGFTNFAEADTFCTIKSSGNKALIATYSGSSSTRSITIQAHSDLGSTSDATFVISGYKRSGTSRTSVSNTEGVVQFENAGSTIWRVLGNGDTKSSTGSYTSFDKEDDIKLIQALNGIIDKSSNNIYTKILKKYGKRLEELGIIENNMRSHDKSWALNVGAMGQIWNAMRKAFKELGITEKKLLEFAKDYS